MIHLTLSAPHLLQPGLLELLQHSACRFMGVRLSLYVRPTQAEYAYTLTQRHLPSCRLLVAWSEAEAMAASGASWNCEHAAWWPAGDNRHGWPEQSHLYALKHAHDDLVEHIGKPCWVGFAGYRADDAAMIEHGGCNFHAVDLPIGPVFYRQSHVSQLVTCGVRVRKIPRAPWQLALATSMGSRTCGYVIPAGQVPAIEMPEACEINRALAVAKEGRWQSRVEMS